MISSFVLAFLTLTDLSPLLPPAFLDPLVPKIAEQIAKISSTKAHIARNEERVVQLLRLMSSA